MCLFRLPRVYTRKKNLPFLGKLLTNLVSSYEDEAKAGSDVISHGFLSGISLLFFSFDQRFLVDLPI